MKTIGQMNDKILVPGLINNNDYYIKCVNCEQYTKLSTADHHSQLCIAPTAKSIKMDEIAIPFIVNQKLEEIKLVILKYKNSFIMSRQYWKDVVTLIEEAMLANCLTQASILQIRKLITQINKVRAQYCGPHYPLLSIFTVLSLLKTKHESLVEGYMKLYQDQPALEHENRNINEYCVSKMRERKSEERIIRNESELMIQATSPRHLTESEKYKKFYYYFMRAKKDLHKTSIGFWIESGPIYNYIISNSIPFPNWEEFIHCQLNENAYKWVTPKIKRRMSKLKLYSARSKKEHSAKSILEKIEEDMVSNRFSSSGMI